MRAYRDRMEQQFRFLTQEQFQGLDPVERGRYLFAATQQLAGYQESIREQLFRIVQEPRSALAPTPKQNTPN